MGYIFLVLGLLGVGIYELRAKTKAASCDSGDCASGGCSSEQGACIFCVCQVRGSAGEILGPTCNPACCFQFFCCNAEPEGAGSMINQDRSTWPHGDRIWDCCQAVAIQEGYSRGPGAAPYDLHNPGDLSPGDEHGEETAGPAEFHGGSYVIRFATANAGWNALYKKISNIVNGQSRTYGQQWTLRQIGSKWAADKRWPGGVGATLGIDPDRDGFYSYVNG